jgi:type IV pilus assembly protein PilQ
MNPMHKIVPYAWGQVCGQCYSLQALIGLLLLCLLPRAALAVTELQGIEYSSLLGDRVQLQLEFSAPVLKPKSFTIDDPARIVLDFPGVKIGTTHRSQIIGLGVTHSLTMVEAADRVRVVVNLARSVPFKVRAEGNIVYVTISGSPVTAPLRSDIAASANRHLIKNIDFRRGDNGEGRAIISLSDAQTPVDIREESGHIVVDFINTILPSKFERRLDVLDFATPVKLIDTFAKDWNVRMVIIPTGTGYDYLSYQSEDTLVVELKPLIKHNKDLTERNESDYVGKKLSLSFQNIEVRAVLQLLADFAGFNLVTSDSVQGSVTLRLKKVPWDQALDIILKTKGLAMRRTGNIILVAPSEEIAAREEQELKAKKQIEELVPLRSEFIQVNFAKASTLADLIQAEGNSFLSPRGKVTVDERTNTLLVMDTADRLAEIRKLIAHLDVPVRQVLIESRIVIANINFSKELGVRFGVSKQENTGGAFNEVTTSGSLNGTTEIINGKSLELQDRLNVNFPVTTKDAARIALAFTKLPLGSLLELELSALQAEGRGKVISNPRVITSNNKEALIEQGTEIPYQQATSSGATSVSFKKAVLSLKVVPQITPDNRIIMDLTVNKDSVGTVFNGVPSINTRQVSTRVLVDNGQTVVLGGIYEQEQNRTSNRVPFLGDLPYVGALFRDKSEVNNKNELLIFVTPKIINEEVQL